MLKLPCISQHATTVEYNSYLGRYTARVISGALSGAPSRELKH